MIDPATSTGRRFGKTLLRLMCDESGAMTVEWLLLTGTVVLPFGVMTSSLLVMLDIYFYRYAGIISLPFP